MVSAASFSLLCILLVSALLITVDGFITPKYKSRELISTSPELRLRLSDEKKQNHVEDGVESEGDDMSEESSSSPPPVSPLSNSSAMVLPDLHSSTTKPSDDQKRKKMGLIWCTPDFCKDVVRERVGTDNQIVLNGPATGQVAYQWQADASGKSVASVLLLVKPGDKELIKIAAEAVQRLLEQGGIRVLLAPEVAAKLTHYYGVKDDGRISLFEPKMPPDIKRDEHGDLLPGETFTHSQTYPDLICTLGGDGLLMHASMMFQGAVPPIISIAGGSLGFLTPFSKQEMVDAIRVALDVTNDRRNGSDGIADGEEQVFPPNMPSYPYEPLIQPPHKLNSDTHKFSFGLGEAICLSIRMRLDCRILNKEGTVTGRFNVLNEVVIDRGSSPYLANLECFVDDLHLTTVQADGIVFAT